MLVGIIILTTQKNHFDSILLSIVNYTLTGKEQEKEEDKEEGKHFCSLSAS